MGLTTVSHPHEELGRAAARLLLALIAGERVETHVVLRPEVVVRGSTAPRQGRVTCAGAQGAKKQLVRQGVQVVCL